MIHKRVKINTPHETLCIFNGFVNIFGGSVNGEPLKQLAVRASSPQEQAA